MEKEFDNKSNPNRHRILRRNVCNSDTWNQTFYLLLPRSGSQSSVQTWLKAWTVPCTQWFIQKQGLQPKFQKLEIEVFSLAKGTPLSLDLYCVALYRTFSVLVCCDYKTAKQTKHVKLFNYVLKIIYVIKKILIYIFTSVTLNIKMCY